MLKLMFDHKEHKDHKEFYSVFLCVLIGLAPGTFRLPSNIYLSYEGNGQQTTGIWQNPLDRRMMTC